MVSRPALLEVKDGRSILLRVEDNLRWLHTGKHDRDEVMDTGR
jgi:hypothetical protein